jgi:hypothetical protein
VAGTDEERQDQVVDRQRRFPDQVAQDRVPAQPAQAYAGEGRASSPDRLTPTGPVRFVHVRGHIHLATLD